MEPTDAHIAAWQTLTDLYDWVGFAGNVADADSVRGSFNAVIGVAATSHWRVLAAITEVDFQALVAAWQVNGTAPTPGQLAQAGIVGDAARIGAGVQKRRAAVAQEKDDELAHQRALALASAVPRAAGPQQHANRTVPMSDVVDIIRKDEPALLGQVAIDKFYETYRKWCHEDPPWDVDVTEEQITGVSVLLDGKAILYVDLAVFGPHGQRVLRNTKLTGLQMASDGRLVKVELRGPATADDWVACMNVFATAVIGLDAISPPHVHRYIKRVKGYATRYGPLCWAVVYQTEVRFRRELAERIRRDEATKFKVATDAGGTYNAYDPARPWDRVYELAGKDMTEFWHEHLEEPCQCICSKARSANAFIDGDAEVARNSRDHLATATGSTVTLFEGAPPDGHKRTAQSYDYAPHIAFGAGPKYKVQKVHNASDGLYSTNRTGYSLCPGWQNGTCTSSISGVICSEDSNKRHQCAKCLSADHGAAHPSPCTKTPKEPTGVQRSKGKPKGSKGGGKWSGGKRGSKY